MTAIADRYRRLARRFTEVIDAVPEDRWESPSPCAGWTAADVLAHVVNTEVEMLGRMTFAAGEQFDTSSPRQAWPIVRDRVQAALDIPADADLEFDGYFGRTTFAATIDRFYSFDLVVHAWDIARATGMTALEQMPADEVESLHMAMAPMGDAIRQPGVFGPEIAVPDDADAQTKLLAFVGRAA